MKYYAVRSGRVPGIYTTWSECQKQISGFSNASYKSFTSKKAAQEFMDGASEGVLNEKNPNAQIERAIENLREGQAIAFCDGSYNKKTKAGGFGVVMITRQETKEMSVPVSKEKLDGSNNFGAEMLGAGKAIQWAIRNGIKSLTIYYDYQGIERFATGEWKPNHSLAVAYTRFVNENKGDIELHFVKVPAHTGVVYNEMVDRLAKRAAGLQA